MTAQLPTVQESDWKDPLAPLLAQCELNTRVFHSGDLCGGVTFDGSIGLGYLHVLKSGCLEVHRSGFPVIHVNVPSFMFFPRSVGHRFKVEAGSAEMVCATFDFGVSHSNPALDCLPDMVIAPLEDVAGIRTATELLFEEAFLRRAGRDVCIDRLADYFLVLLLRRALEGGVLGHSVLPGYADVRLARAFTAMHTHPGHSWTIDSLAYEAGLSRARFAAIFKNATGQTPIEYLTKWRMTVAQNMLRRKKPLSTVALAVGYTNSEAFGRAFTRLLGRSPSEWLEIREATSLTNVPYRRD